MKILIIAFLFVLSQISCNAQQQLSEDIINSLDKCARKLNLDRDQIHKTNQQVEIDEDDEDMRNIFKCHSRDMGVIDLRGQFDFDRLLEVTEARLEIVMKDLSDVHEKAHREAALAVEQCKNLPIEGDVGLQAIKMRNCLRSFCSRQSKN